MKVCSQCRFWKSFAHHRKAGECRLHPPVVANAGMGEVMHVWPSTESGDWCGDFKESDDDNR